MRDQVYGVFVAVGLLAVSAMNTPVLASSPDVKPFITLAQVQQPVTPVPAAPAPTMPAPAAGALQPSGNSPNMPGQMMQPGQGMMGGQGMQPGQGMQRGQMMQPGQGGGMPTCPAGQTVSGTPPTCK